MPDNLTDEYGHPIQVIVDPANPAQLFDNYGRPYIAYEDPSGISLVNHRYEYSHVTNFYIRNKVGSGDGWSASQTCFMYTGATPGSSASADVPCFLLSRPGKGVYSFDFNKSFMVSWKFVLDNTPANSLYKMQLKQDTAMGDLSSKGVGIQVSAGALYAESYGDSRKFTDLSTALSAGVIYRILIVHTPATSIKYYLDSGSGWVLLYTETDTARIPSGDATYNMNCVVSVENGAASSDFLIIFGPWNVAVAIPKV